MPTSRLSRLTTGRRRTCSSPMFLATWAVSSSSKQYLTSRVMTSLTGVLGPLPSAIARTAMSRSVIMPTRWSSSPTGSRPASIASIIRATSSMVWSGRATQTSRVMASLTRMLSSFLKAERPGVGSLGPAGGGQRGDRRGPVEPHEGVELAGQLDLGGVALQLGLGPVDDADEAFQPRRSQSAAQFARRVGMEDGARQAGLVELPLDAVGPRGPHLFDLHRPVPVRGGGDAAALGV